MTTPLELPAEGLKFADLPESRRSDINSLLRQGAPLHAFLNLRFDELGPGWAVMSAPLGSEALSGNGNLHGGVVATLIDVTSGAAAARSDGFDRTQHSMVTADLHVRYLRTPRGDKVSARAEVVHVGRQLIVLECTVTDNEGRQIAAADLGMMIVPLRGPLKMQPPDEAGFG